jgi:hypothetical protein
MANPRPWTIQPYRPILEVEDNLWTVDSDIRMPGGVIPRKMVLIKFNDGRIAIHSPICLSDADMATIESWGELAFCLVPNGFHRLDTPAFKQRYPNLKVLCPDPIRARVAKVVRVDGDYTILPPELRWRTLAMRSGEAAFIWRSGERVTLIFGDALFNVAELPGIFGRIMKLIGSTGGPRVTPMAKVIAVGNRHALAAQLVELAATPGLARLIPGHGDNIDHDAPAILRAVADKV